MSKTTGNAKDTRPKLKPVEKVNLSSKRWPLRLAIVIVAIIVAGLAFGYAFSQLVHGDEGWQTIRASSSELPACDSEMVLRYNLGAGEMSAGAEKKAVMQVYTDACVEMYRLLDATVQYGAVHNMAYINAHPNEEIEVDEPLYRVFELINKYDSKQIFLAPLYADYYNLFSSEDDVIAARFDPRRNADTAEYFEKVSGYIKNVRIVLSGGNTVRLEIPQDYMQFAKDNGIETFIDLWWMRTAFMIDHAAQALRNAGFENGILGSEEGFSTSLGKNGSVSASVYDRENGKRIETAEVKFDAPASAVYFHLRPDAQADRTYRYEYADSSVTGLYLSVNDGLCYAAKEDMYFYSHTAGCGEVLLKMLPVYASVALDTDSVKKAASEGIYSVWCEENTIYATDKNAEITPASGAQYGIVKG